MITKSLSKEKRTSIQSHFRVITTFALLLPRGAAIAAIEEFDATSNTNNSRDGQLACSQAGRVAASSITRLPAVADTTTEVKLLGSDLRAADYDYTLSGCNGACNVIEAGGSGSVIRINANLGGAGQSTVLTAHKRGTKERALLRFNIVENLSIADIAPRDGVLIGTNVQVSGSGLNLLELSSGSQCFDVQDKIASGITLRSKCELGNPTNTSEFQTIAFARSGVSGCTMKIADKNTIRFAARQLQPIDLVADFGVLAGTSLVGAIPTDRRVAESTGNCSQLPGASTRAGQGIGNETTCVVTGVPTTIFKRLLERLPHGQPNTRSSTS